MHGQSPHVVSAHRKDSTGSYHAYRQDQPMTAIPSRDVDLVFRCVVQLQRQSHVAKKSTRREQVKMLEKSYQSGGELGQLGF